jgi:hypothetical protein
LLSAVTVTAFSIIYEYKKTAVAAAIVNYAENTLTRIPTSFALEPLLWKFRARLRKKPAGD